MAENQVQNPPAEKVITLSASLLEPFQGHPFRVASGEEMEQLKESIREYGVLSPLLVRPRGDGRYEIVSGHRHKAACEVLGITELPVLVRDMTDDEAVILMVDSNIQREHILPSEKAFAYKMKMEAVKHQGKTMVEATCGQLGHKSRDSLSQTESGRTVQRYIRLTHLIPSILQMVDEYQIAFNPAVEISYLTEERQRMLKEEMDACQATPSLTQSRTLKQMSKEGTLTREYLHHLLTEEKPNQRQKFFLNQEDVQRYFPKHYTPQQMQQVILHLLHTWQHKRGYRIQKTDGLLIGTVFLVGIAMPAHRQKVHGRHRNNARCFGRQIEFLVFFLVVKCHTHFLRFGDAALHSASQVMRVNSTAMVGSSTSSITKELLAPSWDGAFGKSGKAASPCGVILINNWSSQMTPKKVPSQNKPYSPNILRARTLPAPRSCSTTYST